MIGIDLRRSNAATLLRQAAESIEQAERERGLFERHGTPEHAAAEIECMKRAIRYVNNARKAAAR